MVNPDCVAISPAPQSYYSLSDISKMSNDDSDSLNLNVDHSSNLGSDKKVHQIEKCTSFTSDDEFSEPYIMDDIDEVCKSAEIDAVPRRKGSRKPRPASWCGTTQLILDESTTKFDPEHLKKLQESLKQADMEREVILSCLGKEYIERVTLQSHLQSICGKFGYCLEDLILPKNDKTDSSGERSAVDNKQTSVEAAYVVHKTNEDKSVLKDETVSDLRTNSNMAFNFNGLLQEHKKEIISEDILDHSKDTITKTIEAEQRKSTMKFSHAVSPLPPQLSEKELSQRNYLGDENKMIKSAIKERMNAFHKSSSVCLADSNLKSTQIGLSSSLNNNNRTKNSMSMDQLSSSRRNDRQVFSRTKQKRGQTDCSEFENIRGHPSNLRKYSERVHAGANTGKKLAGEHGGVSIEKCNNKESEIKDLKMDGLNSKQKQVSRREQDNSMIEYSKGENVDEGIVELKSFLTDLIEENQKAAKRIVLLEKKMAKDGWREDIDSSKSDSSNSRKGFINRRRSYTTDDVDETFHSHQSFLRTQHRRSSFSEGRTTSTSNSVSNRLFKSTLSSQQKMKPRFQKKKSRSSDSLAMNSVDVVDYRNDHTYMEQDDNRSTCKSPDVKEVVVTNDDNMKTVFCQASYDTNTFQYIYTIDAEMSNKEYNKLLSIINMLQEQRRKWETEVRELQTKVEVMGKDKVEVVRNNNLLRQSLEAANKAIREINSKVQELKQTIVPLRDDNSRLKEQNQSFRLKFDSVRKEKLKLSQEIHELKKLKMKLEDKISTFETKEEIRRMGKIDEENTADLKGVSLAHSEDSVTKVRSKECLEEKYSSRSKDGLLSSVEDVTCNRVESKDIKDAEKVIKVDSTKVISKDTKINEIVTKESDCNKVFQRVESEFVDKSNQEECQELIRERENFKKQMQSARGDQVEHDYDNTAWDITTTYKNSETDVYHRNSSVNRLSYEEEITTEGKHIHETIENSQQHKRLKEVTVNKEEGGHSEIHQEEKRDTIQQIRKRENYQENLTSTQQNVESATSVNKTSKTTDTETEVVEKINDSKRLRDIEVQNITLMTELQNLRNRLQAYEESVSGVQQAASFVGEDKETTKTHNMQIKQENLSNNSKELTERQLEREEEKLIKELSRRSPISEKARVKASHTAEDVNWKSKQNDQSLKKRSFEIKLPSYALDKSPQGNVSCHKASSSSMVQSSTGKAEMSRWASFSQDSLLDIEEYSFKTNQGRKEKKSDNQREEKGCFENVLLEKAGTSDSMSCKQDIHLSANHKELKAKTGVVKFTAGQQISRNNDTKETSSNPKFKAVIKLTDVSTVSDDGISKKEKHEGSAQSTDGVVNQRELKSNLMGKRSETKKFLDNQLSNITTKDARFSVSGRKRHESLTDREVQEITERGDSKNVNLEFKTREDNVRKNTSKAIRKEVSNNCKTTIKINSNSLSAVTNTEDNTELEAKGIAENKQSNERIHNKKGQSLRETEISRINQLDQFESEHSSLTSMQQNHLISQSELKKTKDLTSTQSSEQRSQVDKNVFQVKSPQEAPKKPLRGILVDRSQVSYQRGAHDINVNYQQSESHHTEQHNVINISKTSSFETESKATSGRLLDSIDSHRNDVVRGVRGTDSFVAKRGEVRGVDVLRSSVEQNNIHQSNKDESYSKVHNNRANTKIAQSEESMQVIRNEDKIKIESQEVQNVNKISHQNTERNSSTVLYLDELTNVKDDQESLHLSRKTRSLRSRPKSEAFGTRNSTDSVNKNNNALQTSNSFYRYGSMRSRRDIERERARREKLSLSLSESNLLYKTGADVSMRRAMKHIHEDHLSAHAHDHSINTTDAKGHIHYHSQEIVQTAGVRLNQTSPRLCYDAECSGDSSTMPKSLKSSSKFNCEMCKELSRRKHSPENKYCREKYFPIAHTDFI